MVRKAIASPLSTLSHPGGGALRRCTAGSIAAMFKTNQMSATLVFVALGCLALGVWCVAAALQALRQRRVVGGAGRGLLGALLLSLAALGATIAAGIRSEVHTSELQSQSNLVCRLLLENKTASKLASGSSMRTSGGSLTLSR